MKACSVCGLLFLLVIQGEPPALLCLGWLQFTQGVASWGEIWQGSGQLPKICYSHCYVVSQLNVWLFLISQPVFQLSSVACQTSGQLKNICLHWLVFERLYGGQTKQGYWHSTGKGPRHKHCICSPTQEAAQRWPFFTFLRKCVSVFVHSTLDSTQM